MSTARKQLPIGIQAFHKIRKNDHYYVDKTALILDLIRNGTHYFLSRPRRFGKSLLIDTLKELYEGNEPLFRGLAIHDQWDWQTKYPVLRFSFGANQYTEQGQVVLDVMEQLDAFNKQHQLQTTSTTCGGRFKELILHLNQQYQQKVVILVDEYDKPILDAINTPEIARDNRDFLSSFYGTLKDYDAHIKFSMLTGVSKFSKVSLFSGLNNLYDITLDKNYSALCGYTDHDIDTVFSPELAGLDRDCNWIIC